MENISTNVESHQEGIDFFKILLLIRKRWYLFVISLILALVGVSIYLQYTIPRYNVSTKIFIKDRSSHAYGSAKFLEGMEMFQPYSNLENEMYIIKSNLMIQKTIDQLDFDYSYYFPGTIKDVEAYQPAYKVVPDTLTPQLIRTQFFVSSKDAENGELVVTSTEQSYWYDIPQDSLSKLEGEIAVRKEFKFGETITIKNSKFKILKDSNSTSKQNFYFILNDKNALVGKWRAVIDVSTVNQQSSIVQINVKGVNVKKCVAFANKLAHVYIQDGLNEKNQIAVNTINFIDLQLQIIKDSLNTVEDDLVNFRAKNKVMDISYESQIDYSKLKDLESERAKLNIRQKYYQYIKDYVSSDEDYSALIVPSTLDINDPNLTNLVANLIELVNEKKSIVRASPSEKNPFLQNINSQIKNTRDALLENLTNLTKATAITIQELNKNIASIQLGLSKLPVTEREFLTISRKFSLNDEIYNYLLEKRAEASIAKASSTPDNKIIDKASIYDATLISPNKNSLYWVAIIGGLLLPLGFIFIKYFLDNKIYTKEDIEERSPVPFLGNIVHNPDSAGNSVLVNPKSGLSESFRSIKVNLEFITHAPKGLVMGVTSFISGEGKTFVSLNLASIYAIAGKKVLLISMDLRKPRMDKEVLESKDAGLSNYLGGMTSMKEIIHHSGKHENLHFIPSGSIPPNPAELLSSERMKELINHLKTVYDIIILDNPPIGLVVDYLNVVKYVDITLYIVRQGVTTKNSLDVINNLYHRENIQHAGIVLNDARQEYNKYYYGMGYYYGNSAGYYEDSTEKKRWYKIKPFWKK